MKYVTILSVAFCTVSGFASAGEVSAARGAQVAIVGGCHDCHSLGYAESGGKVDPAVALTGTSMGYQGPWGTTYPANLRMVAKKMTQEEFLAFAKTFEARPPMPWFNIHAMDDSDIASLYLYLVSFDDPGKPAPDYVPPGQMPKTPYLVFAPPQMPK